MDICALQSTGCYLKNYLQRKHNTVIFQIQTYILKTHPRLNSFEEHDFITWMKAIVVANVTAIDWCTLIFLVVLWKLESACVNCQAHSSRAISRWNAPVSCARLSENWAFWSICSTCHTFCLTLHNLFHTSLSHIVHIFSEIV